MIVFRKIELDDLDVIYKSEFLRQLITVPPGGEKIAIVIDEDGCLIGGASGYREGEGAMIQKVAVKASPRMDVLKDGLVRSLIYILDREGVKFVLAARDENLELYKKLGFVPVLSDSDIPFEMGKLLKEEICTRSCFLLDVEEFFRNSHCR